MIQEKSFIINFQFKNKITTTGIKYRVDIETTKLFPYFTLCPLPLFKKRGFYFTQKDYQENTFNLSDMFDQVTWLELNNSTMYFLKEVSITNTVTIYLFVILCPAIGFASVLCSEMHRW